MDNKVLAVVEGREITEQDLQQLLQSLGPQQAMQFNSEEGRQRLLEELINQELFYLDAKDKNMDEEAEFKIELERAKASLLKQYAMRALLSDADVTEKEVTEYYNNNKEMFKEGEQASAKHILVDDKEKAEEIKKELNEGLSFEEAAKKYSSCPSKEKGGDLGYFTKGRMVPEFEEAAFNMNVGEISDPVKTQFGYHIIKLEDKKDEKQLVLDEVRDQIKQQLIGMKQNDLYLNKTSELKGKYNIETK
ncbi:peptidylprolyl isomerase [Clostridium sp. D2Q-11]|uniref:Peptidylprolyl isomerase n=1 Tax=Anaeromonas frigoriresistens TaxID=2683708 RepID=A0A942UZA0_9FIRM|nr:peptidylprolyl isomerase [Anaeromonas frigoriresistens]MBS4539554.1 peptidylprolyl isomerase [Anaeromonas frigoriresistens]